MSNDYLRKIYFALNDNKKIDIQRLNDEGYTTREIEILYVFQRAAYHGN